MATWNPNQYLRFADERTRPCRDLIGRINMVRPRRIIDLGCGPGNSTEALAERWPEAEITGLDSSVAMLAKAKERHPEWTWVEGDIAAWAAAEGERYDIVFANAALQWLGEHETLLPLLLRRVETGGTLAIQVPANLTAPAQMLMRELAGNAKWAGRFPPGGVRSWFVQETPRYYDILAPVSGRVELWETTYFHVLPDAAAIAEWYKGTGLRPYLDALPDDGTQEQFTAEYAAALPAHYPARADGQVLFPFLRLFLTATAP